MYTVSKILRYQATRDVEIHNENTGTKDVCFDDSALVSLNNFDFMEEGKAYDCRVKLFGDFVESKTDSCCEVRITKPSVFIGKREMIEVKIADDIYYIPMAKANNIDVNDRLFFKYSRKDLIQVDDVIHNDYL